ncbi:protein Shroom1 [Onychostruthus taczanowskii]|uniref:protein Shroom1 n=1 Tax=Onychostruthus taczanowskii TaxID=356909 RepID=UPI001B80257A|nr:protein Shroom1 [Onychostruthus taczanowskii]
MQREGHQLQRGSHHHQRSADDLQLQNKDLIFRSPPSFTEESFQNDYIEKLKVAQKKVLKETSFKRKDLQMSLPVRLRQKSSKRPSVEHVRSFSLSSASEDAKPVPCSPSHLESLESFNRSEEIRRPQKGDAGRRKRVTHEQKKLCYSEPEKLNHLMDKEVPWGQVRDETTEHGTVASRRRDLENRGKTFSSSTVSRTELKQIQHSALIKYMERKISQRRRADVPEVQQHRASAAGAAPVSVILRKIDPRIVNIMTQLDIRKSHGDGPEECPKSEHETKQRSKDPTSMRNQVLKRNRDSTNELDDITSKKLELMASLQSRLQALWEEQELVLLEVRECARRGEELEVLLRELCKPKEFERYLMFIGDLEKVLSLLLCLSSRLARVQNALSRVDGSTEPEEKQSLNERHKLLSRQREDAKDLKENLDRRERVVSGILAKYLTEQQLQDYQHFVQVKTSLLIEQKDLEEQIKFFEEQLENLEQSIPI